MSISDPQNNTDWTFLKKILSWPSGAAWSILRRCSQPVQSYYCALGSGVYVAALISGFGMRQMVLQATGSPVAGLIAAPVWAGIVLVLDRLLLLTTHVNAGTIWGKAQPIVRILLAIALAILIGEQVVQMFFAKEIGNELALESLDAQKTNLDRAGEAVPELAGLTQDKRNTEIQIERKEAEVSQFRDDYIREAEGTGGSRLRGKGPLFDQKRADYDRGVRELEELRGRRDELEARLQEKLRELQAIARPANDAKAAEKGFLANHRALKRIVGKDLMLLLFYVMLSFIGIAIEITPLLVKMNHAEDMYDRLAAADSTLQETQLQQETELARHTVLAENLYARALADKRHEIEIQAVRNANSSPEANAVENDNNESPAGVARNNVRAELIRLLRTRQVNDNAAPPEQPFAVTVLPDDEVGEGPFVLVFQHSQDQLLGSDVTFSLAALEKQRRKTPQYVPFDECIVTNAQGEKIVPQRRLLPQLKGRELVCLSSPSSSARMT